MTLLDERPTEEPPASEHREATGLLAFLTTTDHKRIGIAYMLTAFAFYLVGGALALVMPTELAAPGQQVVGNATYNEPPTLPGTTLLCL